MKEKQIEGITHLGSGINNYTFEYQPGLLECFANKHPENDYFVRLNCPEFTCLCPMTGQPDFGTIIINYIPDKKLVESKSLKLYLFSFRNYGDFHENSVNTIMKDLIDLLHPKYIEVTGEYTPRGGISIYPFVNYGQPSSQWEAFAQKRLLDYGKR